VRGLFLCGWLVDGGDFFGEFRSAICTEQSVEDFCIADSLTIACDRNCGFDFFTSVQMLTVMTELDDEARVLFGFAFPDQCVVFPMRMPPRMDVSFFLEVACVGSAIDFSTHRAFVFHNGSEAIVRSDEAGRPSVRLSIQWHWQQVDLNLRLLDRQQECFSRDWCGRLFIAAQNVHCRLLLVMIDRELDVIHTAAPIGKRSVMWTSSMTTMCSFAFVRVTVI
jgi:hypothetical protein